VRLQLDNSDEIVEIRLRTSYLLDTLSLQPDALVAILDTIESGGKQLLVLHDTAYDQLYVSNRTLLKEKIEGQLGSEAKAAGGLAICELDERPVRSP
jgi:hypothetical protein